MDTMELEGKWNKTKGMLEQKLAMLTDSKHHYIDDWNLGTTKELNYLKTCEFCNLKDSEHHYINDWNLGTAKELNHLKTCEFCNLNQKFCNTTRH